MLKKFCATCKILDPRQNVCALLRTEVDPHKDYCTKHTDTLDVCAHCGRETINAILTPDGDSWQALCAACVEKLNTCVFCKNVNTCAFETDPSPLPKMVQKQVRQGNMVQVMTIQNPERIAITCQSGCSCYNEEYGCGRQFDGCQNMAHIYDKDIDNPKEECKIESSDV